MEDLHIMLGEIRGTVTTMLSAQSDGARRAQAAENEMKDNICRLSDRVSACQKQIENLSVGVQDYQRIKKIAVRGAGMGGVAIIASLWDLAKARIGF